jgi:hypothetical protein
VYKARVLLEPGCESELVLSTSISIQCGMHSQVDEETLVKFGDGTRVPSTSIENVILSVAGVSHPVRVVDSDRCLRLYYFRVKITYLLLKHKYAKASLGL